MQHLHNNKAKTLMKKLTTFSDRVIFIQKTEKLTQGAFSNRLGISRPGLSRLIYDGGKASFDVLLSFREKFKVDLNWLIAGDGLQYGDLDKKVEKKQAEENQDLKIELVRRDLKAAKMEIAYLKKIIEEKEKNEK